MSLRRSPAWLWLLVVVQLAIPSSYYLLRDDSDDERFAWRMFSTVRLRRCQVQAVETSRDGVMQGIDIPSTLHASWIRSLERGRAHVIEQFLRMRCQHTTVASSALDRRCVSAAGAPLPSASYRYDCASGRLEASP